MSFNYSKYSKQYFKEQSRSLSDLTPKDIHERLSTHVVGLDLLKKRLSVLGYKQLRRLKNKDGGPKTSILMIGKTGTGKTFSVQTLAKILDVPFVHIDCSTLVTEGYHGPRLSDMAKTLRGKPGASKAIVLLDEIDKVLPMGSDAPPHKQVAVQYELLRAIEGTTLVRDARHDPEMTINTHDMLFIAGGSFRNLVRPKDKRRLGVTSDEKTEFTTQDFEEALTKQGLLPELLGRFSDIIELPDITEELLVSILDTPKSVLNQYLSMFRDEMMEFSITEEAKKVIAKEAMEYKMGARALLKVVEHLFAELQYRYLGQFEGLNITIDKSDVQDVLTKHKG